MTEENDSIRNEIEFDADGRAHEVVRLGLQNLPIGRIVVSPRVQPRRKLDSAVVNQYARLMRAGVEFPPLLVGLLRSTPDLHVFVLIDGFHRHAALSKVGGALHSQVIEVRDWEEARWLATKANMAHGLQLSAAERREAFNTYVRAGQLRGSKGRIKSSREIGADLGISHMTVLRRMAKEYPAIYRRMREDQPGNAEPQRGPSAAERLAAEAEELLIGALAAVAGVDDPVARGLLHARASQVVRALEKRGPIESMDF